MIKGFVEFIGESEAPDHLRVIKRLHFFGLLSMEDYIKELEEIDSDLAFEELTSFYDSGKINKEQYYAMISSNAINVEVRCTIGVASGELYYDVSTGVSWRRDLEEELDNMGLTVVGTEDLPYNDEAWTLEGGFADMIQALLALGWDPENEEIEVIGNQS
jgi:hypothetical protein